MPSALYLAFSIQHRASIGDGHTVAVADVTEWAEDPKTIPDFGPIDGLIWSAGVCQLAVGSMLSARALRATLLVNLKAPLLVTSHLHRKKVRKKGTSSISSGKPALVFQPHLPSFEHIHSAYHSHNQTLVAQDCGFRGNKAVTIYN